MVIYQRKTRANCALKMLKWSTSAGWEEDADEYHESGGNVGEYESIAVR